MSTEIWDFIVLHYNPNTMIETDITSDVIGLPIYSDQGTISVNNARIKLDSPNGEFINQSPVINEYDNIRIRGFMSDPTGGSYDHIFEVIRMIPSEDDNGGTVLELVLLGQEHNIQKLNYSKTHYWEGTAEVIQDIGDNYNRNKGSLQPTLSGHKVGDPTNQAPTSAFQTSIYSYGINEEIGYNRLQETVDKLGSSVDLGGALDYYEIKVDTDNTTYDSMTLNIFSSGANGSIILTDTENVNTGETEGGIDARVATLINVWGAVDNGTLPIDQARYASRELRFPLLPRWADTETYQTGSLIQDGGIVYKSLINSNTNLQPSFNLFAWQVVTANDYFRNTIQYSPWTVDKSTLWVNAGSDRKLVGPFGLGCFDCNTLISDAPNEYNAVRADTKALGFEAIPSELLYSGTGDYRGLSILINGTAIGVLATDQFGTGAGNDRNGKSYTNSISQYTGQEWRVKHSAFEGLECNVIDEGQPYTFVSSNWILEIIISEGNRYYAFHPYNEIINVPGSLNEFGQLNGTINENSAIRVRRDFNTTQILTRKNDDFYKVGAWINFRFPFPISTYGGVGENVGELYGGKKQVAGVPDLDKEPTTLDQQNMNATHDGFRGFAHNLSSEDYGQISSLDFDLKLDSQASNLGLAYFTTDEANFNMRCIIEDTNDNQVFSDFTLKFNNKFEQIHLTLSSFQTYRGRRPLDNASDSLIPLVQLEALNIFEWRNIKNIIIQTQDVYDSEGRYSPLSFENPKAGKFSDAFKVTQAEPIPIIASIFRRVDMYIDNFRFTKPLLVNTGKPSDRVIEKEFLQRPDIGNYDQLKSDAFAELEKTTFPRVEYIITTQGRFDIKFGDSFWYRTNRLIPEQYWSDDSPDGNNTNTIKLVAKKIEYSMLSAKDSKGGFLRTITGVRRFT